VHAQQQQSGGDDGTANGSDPVPGWEQRDRAEYQKRESDEERARQYLQKLINITVPVPEIDPRKSVIS